MSPISGCYSFPLQVIEWCDLSRVRLSCVVAWLGDLWRIWFDGELVLASALKSNYVSLAISNPMKGLVSSWVIPLVVWSRLGQVTQWTDVRSYK
jgi:hypothetical protein